MFKGRKSTVNGIAFSANRRSSRSYMEYTGWIIEDPAISQQNWLFSFGCIQPQWTVHRSCQLGQLALHIGFARA